MPINVLSRAVAKALPELEASSQRERWRNDPVLWAKERLGVFTWSKQHEIMYSVRDHHRTAVRSCNNASKTHTAGLLGAWFIDTHDPHDTIVVCTAPTFNQIRTNLFPEFANHLRASKSGNGEPLPGYITASNNVAEWKYADGTQLAIGRRPSDRDAITSLQGIHRRNVLVIIDEAGGIPSDLFVAAERITTTGNARILAIGNPDRLGSEFHKMFKDGSDWNQIHISGYDTPLFTGEDFPEDAKEYLLQPEWVERQKRVWGEDDPRYQISILGEFPDTDDLVFFPQSTISRAIDTEIEDDTENPMILGVDLARYGNDSSCIYTNRGGRIRKYAEWSKASAVESANRVHQAALDTGARYVNVDAGGLGGPIIDNILTMGGNYTVVQMNGSGATPDPRRWLNARAWWYDSLREKMSLGERDIDPEDADLIAEMGDINAEYTNRGAIQVEGKKELKSRTGGSPDHLDAAVYASYNPEENPETPKKEQFFQDFDDIIGEVPGYLMAMTDWA